MDFSRLLKAGVLAGVIYGILQGIVSVLSYILYRDQIIEMLRATLSGVSIPLTMDQLADIGMMYAIPGSIIGGIIAGIIVCFILSMMHNELLGRDSKRKGVFLSLLILAGIIAGELAHPGVIGGVFMVQTRFILLAPISAAFFVVLGLMLGLFYDRFDTKRKGKECKAKR